MRILLEKQLPCHNIWIFTKKVSAFSWWFVNAADSIMNLQFLILDVSYCAPGRLQNACLDILVLKNMANTCVAWDTLGNSKYRLQCTLYTCPFALPLSLKNNNKKEVKGSGFFVEGQTSTMRYITAHFTSSLSSGLSIHVDRQQRRNC